MASEGEGPATPAQEFVGTAAADIRVLQQLLGRATFTTTQPYAHVWIPQVQAIPIATHPAARPSSPQAGAPASAGPDSTHEWALADAPAGLLPRARSGA